MKRLFCAVFEHELFDGPVIIHINAESLAHAETIAEDKFRKDNGMFIGSYPESSSVTSFVFEVDDIIE